MNVQDIWSGTEYAYVPNRGRNIGFPMTARRVKCIKTYKRQEFGNERKSAYVEVQHYDRDGNLTERTTEVRARELYDFYTDWKDEYDHRIAEREKIALQQEEQQRLDAEQSERIRAAIAVKLGVLTTDITVTATTVQIRRLTIERILELNA